MTIYIKRDGAEMRVARCHDRVCVKTAAAHGYTYYPARQAAALERRHQRRKRAVVQHVEGVAGIVRASGQLALLEGWG